MSNHDVARLVLTKMMGQSHPLDDEAYRVGISHRVVWGVGFLRCQFRTFRERSLAWQKKHLTLPDVDVFKRAVVHHLE